mmetsp:Transcript_21900/g.37846  ORF Transcript_21900/g.37846 Transcript_21900/m.37846 type:complete len:260 (-) Transcript_21900:1197-1976(-)
MLANALPQGSQHAVEGFNAVRERRLSQRRQTQRSDCAYFLLLVNQSVLGDRDHHLQVGQHCSTHQNGYLLNYLDARVACLPALAALTHSFEERQQRGDAQRRGHDSEGPGGGVADILVRIVNVGTHRGDHGGQPRRFGQVGNDLTALYTRVVVLVDEQRLDDHQHLVHEGPHQVAQLVQHAVDHLHQQMPLLVFQGGRHQQRQNLIKQTISAELCGLVCNLTHRRFSLGRSAVFDLEQQLHDLPLAHLFWRQVLFFHLF